MHLAYIYIYIYICVNEADTKCHKFQQLRDTEKRATQTNVRKDKIFELYKIVDQHVVDLLHRTVI
jgi:hypothetical protein